MKDLFLLDPDITFLNHGSFGACPRPVFETYQRWQRELERQPVEFLGRRYDALMDDARAKLAAYLGADVAGLIFVPNATVGINLVARSIKLQAEDEVLTTDHEYGAVDMTWQFACDKVGACYIRQPMPLPMTTPEDFIERFWQGVTPRTKVIAISHITSPTALIFPIAEICRRAREAGILTVIDGAHAPGQLDLDLTALDADFYTGNCHKWLCAPKGAAFLYAKPEHHAWLEPLIISWGYGQQTTFAGHNQWQGTRDIAAFLSVPAAIEFQAAHEWSLVREQCHELAMDARRAIDALTKSDSIAPDSWFGQMVTVRVPTGDITGDILTLKTRLYDEHHVEVPAIDWNGQTFIRVSLQGYNTLEDVHQLLSGLQAVGQF